KGEVEDYLLDFRVAGSIGDSVWLDEDGDGIEDIFEPGIANVTVNLFDSGNNLIATTITDANGEYLFTNIFAGDYYVDIVSGVPVGLSTAPATSDPSAIFTLTNGEEKRDVDFGYIPSAGTAVIGDQVFSDVNNNGQQDPGEIGIAGQTMKLVSDAGVDGIYGTPDDTIVATTVTLDDGSYLFTGIAAGDYVVTINDTTLVAGGYTVTSGAQSPGDNETEPFTVVADQIYTDADFGYFNAALFSYTDRVWLDANNDAIFAGEQGIEAVTINLVDGSGKIIATTVTDVNGLFSFTGLPDLTTYSVVIADTDNVLGTLDATTSGATNGLVPMTTAGSNIDISSPNPSFGYYEFGGVSGLIWSDANGDGSRDEGEAAIAGVTVELQGNGCISGSTCPTTTTAIDGSYLFDGFLPASYTVVVNPVVGVGSIVTGYASQTGDPDGALDNVTVVTVVAGAMDENNDFGYQNTAFADISGTVFYDTDADGTYEINGDDGDVATVVDNEYGIVSVTIELQDGNGNIIATTTAAADGTYTFPDLPAASYTVVVTDTNQVLSGYESTSGLDSRFVTLAAVDVIDVDFGYVDKPLTASIGDTVWLDKDNDGIQDPDEPGLSAVDLSLYEDSNANGIFDGGDVLIANTVTDANGLYRFDSLASGQYFVDVIEADLPANLTATTFISGSSSLIALSEGEFVEDADFGFTPNVNTGILSGLVWSDDDSDGLADTGEVGMGDGTTIVTITVTNVNTGVTFTTKSNPDGSWMITGLPPADYSVKYASVDIPAGYIAPMQPTNFSVGNDTYNLTLAANQTINNLDFGFDPGVATGGISGTIYNDLNKNNAQDGGEFGIWDVSLNLLDCGVGTCDDGDETIVASLITDINGDYAFTGIPPANYLVAISDISGTLDELNPTETLPTLNVVVAGATTVNVDAGFASGNALGSIGNLVFMDVNNSSSFQIGEPGIAGVSVQCWSDTNNNGTIEPGTDNLIRTVITDDNGEYYCNSVPTGFYVVRVTDRDGLLTGLTSTGVAFVDADNISQTSPYPLQTASPNYNADFGYLGNLTISGTVFEDENNDTIHDALEIKVLNASVYLYKDLDNDGVLDAGEPRVATTRTLVDGSYQFTGIPAGNYILVPDAAGTTVSGYTQTTQSGTNGIIAVSVGPDSANNDFGFYDSGVTTTPVTLSSFKATSRNNRTDFEWSTETETGNIGFKILIGDNVRELTELVDLIPSEVIDSLEPQFYSTSVNRNDFQNVWIVDIDIFGNETKHGPYKVNKQYGKKQLTFEKVNWGRIRSQSNQRRLDRIAAAENVSAIDIRVSKDGVYRVTYEVLFAAGFDINQLRANQLNFELNGSSVAVYAHIINSNKTFGPGSWIEFIGEKINNNIYTETNLYRLALANNNQDSLTLILDNDTLFNEIDSSVFHSTEQFKDEDNSYSFVAPGDDPWFRDQILAFGADATMQYEFDIDHLKTGLRKLDYEIWGGTDFGNVVDHHIQISVNGDVLVDTFLDGLNTLTGSVEIPDNLLIEGVNDIQVKALLENGIRYSLINTNWIGLEFNSSLVVENDYLDFKGITDLIFSNSYEEQVVSVKGFEVEGLSVGVASVYARSGKLIEKMTHTEFNVSANGYSVFFADVSPTHDYIVAAQTAIMMPELTPVRNNAGLLVGDVDYLMVSHPDFIATLESLKTFHENNGLKVKIVDIEDIYYQYNGGIVAPEAISAYIQEAKNTFDLRYVLLVGGDSFDYLNNLGLGSFSFIPSFYVETNNLITYTPSDVPFVDFNHDNIQDMALGRFPVRTVDELQSMIAKTIQYATNTYTRTSIFAADQHSIDGNFALYSEGLVNTLPVDWGVTRAYLDEYNQIDTTNILVNEINSGISMVNYFGHSGPSTWSFNHLFGIADVEGLTNDNLPTVVVQWGCWNAYHVTANANTMAHKFLVNSNGAAAILGASTLTKVNSERALGKIFVPLVTQPGMSIGQALVNAKQQLAQQHPDYLDVLLGYLLLGDPAIEVSK
ncbi:MAG: hypothetical protein JKY19_11085, partial [Alcanivoracaceae bacterium]|nr:hypothetical protein [Alcanivoracaceae bacterium]